MNNHKRSDEVITVLQSSGWQLRRYNVEIMLMTRKLRNYNLFHGVGDCLVVDDFHQNQINQRLNIHETPISMAIARQPRFAAKLPRLLTVWINFEFSFSRKISQTLPFDVGFWGKTSQGLGITFLWKSRIASRCIIGSEFPSEWLPTQLKNRARKVYSIKLTFEFISRDFRAMFGLFRHFSFSLGDLRCRSLAVCW